MKASMRLPRAASSGKETEVVFPSDSIVSFML